MTESSYQVGLLVTQSLLRSENNHAICWGSDGLQFIRAFVAQRAAHANIHLLFDHPDTQRECAKLITQQEGSPSLPWLASEHWDRLDVIHSFGIPDARLISRRGAAGNASWLVSGTVSKLEPLELRSVVLENYSASDVLFCSSEAVLQSVESVWALEIRRLQRRLGSLNATPPLPRLVKVGSGIPSPVRFNSNADRLAARTTLKVGPEEVLVLQAGHVDPARGFDATWLYRIAAEAQKRLMRPIRVIDCCSFASESIKQKSDLVARDLGLAIKRAENRHEEHLLRCLAGADVFVGLQTDLDIGFHNIHLQAMAAGLPCVLSDWGLYKHAIADASQGQLIATTIPHRNALPKGLQDRPEPWSEMLGINFEQAVQTLVLLCKDQSLRQAIGHAGQEHAFKNHDWSVVLAHYQTTWAEQCRERGRLPRPPKVDTARLALSDVYRPFASRMLDQQSVFWPLRGIGQSDLRGSAARLMLDKAPDYQRLPSASQEAIGRDNMQLLQWLNAQHVQGATAQQVSEILGRLPAQRLADLARLPKLGLAQNFPPKAQDFQRPLSLLHLDLSSHQASAFHRLTKDRRIAAIKLENDLLTGLVQAEASGQHALWIAQTTTPRDYWLYERLQDAFMQYAVVLPIESLSGSSPPADLQSLPWLAVRHDALRWFLAFFSKSAPKRGKSSFSPWRELFRQSQTNNCAYSLGTWPIDLDIKQGDT